MFLKILGAIVSDQYLNIEAFVDFVILIELHFLSLYSIIFLNIRCACCHLGGYVLQCGSIWAVMILSYTGICSSGQSILRFDIWFSECVWFFFFMYTDQVILKGLAVLQIHSGWLIHNFKLYVFRSWQLWVVCNDQQPE